MGGEELGGDAGVLAGDQVGRGELVQRAERHVLQVPDRRGDEDQPRRPSLLPRPAAGFTCRTPIARLGAAFTASGGAVA